MIYTLQKYKKKLVNIIHLTKRSYLMHANLKNVRFLGFYKFKPYFCTTKTKVT